MFASQCFGEKLPVRTYTSADGLGSSFVDYLIRDSRGFMWFCTRDGLSRYDGASLITYKIGDAASPPGIESIAETHDGTYWIMTTGGLYRFKPGLNSQAEATIGIRPTLNAEFVGNWRGDLLEDRIGNLWFGSEALYRIEQRDGKPTFHQVDLNLPANSNRSFSIAKYGASPRWQPLDKSNQELSYNCHDIEHGVNDVMTLEN